jgi:phage gp45-like
MGLAEDLARWIGPLKRAVSVMVGKAVISAIDDSEKLQVLQVNLLSGEVKDEIERIQEAGFTSVPLADGEAVAVCIGGNRDNMVIIATDNSATRPKGLSEGDVCLYHIKKPENRIHIKDGEISIEVANLKVTGNITADGSITGKTGVNAGVGGAAVGLLTHLHTSAAPGSPTTPPTPGT